MEGHSIFIGEIQGDVQAVKVIICEIFLEDMLFIVGTKDEVIEAVVVVQFHNVLENGLAADLNYGLEMKVAFFADAGLQATNKDDGFHDVYFF